MIENSFRFVWIICFGFNLCYHLNLIWELVEDFFIGQEFLFFNMFPNNFFASPSLVDSFEHFVSNLILIILIQDNSLPNESSKFERFWVFKSLLS